METHDLFTQAEKVVEQEARARTHDRKTSHDAARSVGDLNQKQQAVLECIRDFHSEHGAADVEWMETYKRFRWVRNWPAQSDSGLRTRRNELFLKEKLHDVGTKHIGHRDHTVWKVAA